jgi:hypothetical protein
MKKRGECRGEWNEEWKSEKKDLPTPTTHDTMFNVTIP